MICWNFEEFHLFFCWVGEYNTSMNLITGGKHAEILCAGAAETEWKLPLLSRGMKWNLLLDTSEKFVSRKKIASGGTITVPAWSVLLFEIKK